MPDDRGGIGLETVVHAMVGDETILCVIATARGRVSIVVNEHYSDALTHARGHISRGFGGVQVCSPDCSD